MIFLYLYYYMVFILIHIFVFVDNYKYIRKWYNHKVYIK
jgi:hypothetical protein